MQALAIILAVLLLLSLITFVYYLMKGGNLIIGLTIISVAWFLFGTIWSVTDLVHAWDPAVHGGVSGPGFFDVWANIVGNLNTVFSDGPIGYGTTTAIIIFASWFGRVVVDTGIAKALIRKVVELSGSRQLVTVCLVSVVSALIFTSIFGPGSVMAIGAIILPILLSIGVSKKIAVGSFMFSVAAGMYVNTGYSSQFSGNGLFSPIWDLEGFISDFTIWTWLSFLIHVAIMLGYILFNFHFAKDKVKAWAMTSAEASDDYEVDENGESPEKPVSNWTFIVPFIPIIFGLVITIPNLFLPENDTTNNIYHRFVEFAPIFLFIVGIFFGLLLTGNLKSYKKAVAMTQKTLFNGFSDVALLIGMLLMMNCFSTAANKLAAPIFQQALNGGLDWINDYPWIILIIFIALAPGALFRGPFMVWGSGIAVASVLGPIIAHNPAGLTPLLLVLFYVQPVAITAQCCPTQSWGMWALSYSKLEPNVYIKTNIVWGWVTCGIVMTLGYLLLML